ncbi:MAG: Ribonuclease [Candidatus Saccharibacteria bacterium]|nr:Ribonuclease [Candidatus Saccharibacteria bacterium]
MWQETNNALYKEFIFKDFKAAFDFMAQVAAVAEAQRHHPRWANEWNKVEIWLTTHSAGSHVTDKDHELARAIDALLETEDTVVDKKQEILMPKEVKLFADGGSRGNPGPSASGYVILDMEDNLVKKSGIYLGITTNNQAEYQALKFGLEDALKNGVREVQVFMDSMLVVNQMKGIFKVKNRDLWPIHEAIKELVQQFKQVSFTHVPREFNKLADAEVNEALDAAKEQP